MCDFDGISKKEIKQAFDCLSADINESESATIKCNRNPFSAITTTSKKVISFRGEFECKKCGEKNRLLFEYEENNL